MMLIAFLLSRFEVTERDEPEQTDRGAALLEYGLLLFLIALAVLTVLTMLGPAVADLFQAMLDALP